MLFSKEINKHLLLQLKFSKLVGKVNLTEKIWGNELALNSKKVQGIFAETFLLALAIFRHQNCVSDFFQFVLLER